MFGHIQELSVDVHRSPQLLAIPQINVRASH